jgi:hypothetical protein
MRIEDSSIHTFCKLGIGNRNHITGRVDEPHFRAFGYVFCKKGGELFYQGNEVPEDSVCKVCKRRFERLGKCP